MYHASSIRRAINSPGLNRRRALGLTAAGTAAFLAACGSKKGGSSSTATNGGNAGKPVSGGQINVAIQFQWPSLDIATTSNDKQTVKALGLANDRLTGFKAGPAVQYKDLIIEPRLATKWETADAQSYTFHLRNDVKFANLPPVNGRPFTSADVKWTYEYFARIGSFSKLPKRPITELFSGLDRVDTPDDYTAVFHFKQPFAPFMTYASTMHASILPHEIQEQDGDFTKRLVGTGPWQVDPSASQKDVRQSFKRNPTYWGSGLPYIDQVNCIILPDSTTQQAAFQTKQIDIFDPNGITLDIVNQTKKNAPDAVVFPFLQPSGGHLYINVTQPPMNDTRIRQAFALSLDHDAMVTTLAHGQGEAALAGGMPGLFTAAELKQLLKRDVAQAKQLVSAAGFASGIDVELMYPGNKYGDVYVSLIQLMQAQLKEGGINLILKDVDPTTEGARKKKGDFVTDITGKSLLNDLDDYLYGVFHPSSPHNYGHVNDPQLTPILEAQRRETDPAKRTELWKQAVRRITDQAWAVAFFYPQIGNLWQPYLKNYAPNWGSEVWPITSSWIAK